jgi:hypothetical protein
VARRGPFTVEVTVSGLADLLRVDSATATKDKINSLSVSGKAAALSSYFDAHSADTGLHYSTLKPDTQVLELRVVGEGGTTQASLLLSSTALGTGDVAQRGYAEVQPAITALSSKAWISEDVRPASWSSRTAELSLRWARQQADRLLTLRSDAFRRPTLAPLPWGS